MFEWSVGRIRLGLLACCLLAAPWSGPAFAAEHGPVRHTLEFPRRASQYVSVRSEFPASGDETLIVLPSWTPGSYLIRDYAAQVENLSATGPDGRPLAAVKTAKDRWRVETGGLDRFTVRYDVWAGKLNVSHSWVESSIALINGAGIFMFTDESRSLGHRVELRLPPDWSHVHAAMRPGGAPGTFRAADYDELVDSPILAGNTVEYEFRVEDQDYGLVLSGNHPFWSGETAGDDVEKVVTAHQAFWGVNPFDRKYLFLNLFMGPFGGLEHDHSTVLMTDPLYMRVRKDYIRWLGLVSHEFFHAWNVRRMRPEAFARYEYDREMYTRELWLAEGLTSYYDDLLLLRAGLIQVSEYLELLAAEIRNFETTPGREIRSAELASFDTWIKHYKKDGNSVNSTISYYRKGAVIGFVSDMVIRRDSDGRASLDTVMRTLYQRYASPGEGGYPPGAFEAVVGEVAGPSAQRAVAEMIRSTADPDIDEALDWYGLLLNRSPDNGAGAGAATPPAGFGVVWKGEGMQLMVEHVLQGHAGAAAGLLPGDEVLAIAGTRVTPLDYAAFIQRLQPGEQLDITVARHGRLMNLQVEVGQAIPDTYRIIPDPKIRKRQKNRMEDWLGLDLVFTRN